MENSILDLDGQLEERSFLFRKELLPIPFVSPPCHLFFPVFLTSPSPFVAKACKAYRGQTNGASDDLWRCNSKIVRTLKTETRRTIIRKHLFVAS